jgi:hypothetical protein
MNRLNSSSQQGILAGVPRQAGYLFNSEESNPLGHGAKKNASAALPITQSDLVVWLRGADNHAVGRDLKKPMKNSRRRMAP